MNHVFITRHGKSIHNKPGNNHFWDYANDDILGLTEEGIVETVAKAKQLALILDQSVPTTITHTRAVRSFQSASLIASELRRKYGFKPKLHCRVDLEEIPTPTPDNPLPKDFSFEEFKADPSYSCKGWMKTTYKQQFHFFAEGFQLPYSAWLTQVQGHDIEDTQEVIVGHHYNLCSLLGAMLYVASKTTHAVDLMEQTRALVGSHKFYLHHDDLLYLSPMAFSDLEVTSERDRRFYSVWKTTEHRLKREVLRDADVKIRNFYDNVKT